MDAEAADTPPSPPVLFAQTQPLLERLEAKLGGPVVTYWGGPSASMRHVDVRAIDHVLASAEGEGPLHLFVRSDGGAGTAALRMTHLLHHGGRRVVALVPLDCASAATMLALGANEIRLGRLGYLTPVDTSIRHELSPRDFVNDRVSVSQDELARVVRLWRETQQGDAGNAYEALFAHVHPLVIGAVDRASSLSERLCTEILAYHLDDADKAAEIARRLTHEFPAHHYPITLSAAQELGLHASELDGEVNAMLMELAGLYSAMSQKVDRDDDASNSHSEEIRKILEVRGCQVRRHIDKDWHYRESERRWVSLNDRSAWREVTNVEGEQRDRVLHLT